MDIAGGRTKDGTMTENPVILASAIVLLSSVAFAQQQYDSLGSPTPAPKQGASPYAANPNVPIPGDKSAPNTDTTRPNTDTTSKAAADGSRSTTGSANGMKTPSNGKANAPISSGMQTDHVATRNDL